MALASLTPRPRSIRPEGRLNTDIRIGPGGEGTQPSPLFPYFLPFLPMGQYFKAVNLDKEEYVCPWCMGGGAKLWEWAANTQGSIFTLLLRKSDEGGGGDFYGYRKGCAEGGPICCPVNAVAGRWAGDRVCLVGDYDSSKLWERLRASPEHHEGGRGYLECLHRTARPPTDVPAELRMPAPKRDATSAPFSLFSYFLPHFFHASPNPQIAGGSVRRLRVR